MANVVANYVDPYDLDDLINQPQCANDHILYLEAALVQMELDDCFNKCGVACAAKNAQQLASQNYFRHLLGLWELIHGAWEPLKALHKKLRQKKAVEPPFTLWVSDFLYSNNILSITVTDGKEIKYKQIKRYVSLPFDKVRQFWELDNSKGLILPCDVLVGPFIANNRQLFSAGQLYKLMASEQSNFDESLTLVNNCRSMPHLLYYYSDILPFQMIKFNKYDRKIYFAENPSQSGRRADLVVRQPKNGNKLSNRHVVRLQSAIDKLKNKVDSQEQEIIRKERVLQFTLTAHNNLKNMHKQLQDRYDALYARFG